MARPRKYASHADRQAAYRRRCDKAREEQLAAKGLPPAPSLPTMPGTRRWQAAYAQALALVQSVLDEQQQYFDDRSQAWQESDRGEKFQEVIDATEHARNVLADLLT